MPDVGARAGPVELGRAGQIRTRPVGRLHLRGDDAGGAVGGDPLDLHVLQRRLDGLAEPLRDPLRVAGDLEADQREVAGRRRARVQLGRGSPTATKNGSCGSEIRPLTPICRQVSSTPSGRWRLPLADSRPSRFSTAAMSSTATTQPSQPPPSSGAGPDGLAERRLVGGRVVEHLDDLEVLPPASGSIMLRVPKRG